MSSVQRSRTSHVKEQAADTGSVSSLGWRRGGVSDPTRFIDGQQRWQPLVGMCLFYINILLGERRHWEKKLRKEYFILFILFNSFIWLFF